MSCILRVKETSKQRDRVEAHVPRAWGRCCGGPCDGCGCLDVSIALARRELGICGEQPVCLQKAITELPTERDIAFDRIHQHDATPGHGWATVDSMPISTLAYRAVV